VAERVLPGLCADTVYDRDLIIGRLVKDAGLTPYMAAWVLKELRHGKVGVTILPFKEALEAAEEKGEDGGHRYVRRRVGGGG
jgi:hypothetical protein